MKVQELPKWKLKSGDHISSALRCLRQHIADKERAVCSWRCGTSDRVPNESDYVATALSILDDLADPENRTESIDGDGDSNSDFADVADLQLGHSLLLWVDLDLCANTS